MRYYYLINIAVNFAGLWISCLFILNTLHAQPNLSPSGPIEIPFLKQPPTIDGDLSEWKNFAFHDGVWDLERVIHTPWYEPSRNRLTLHPGERADAQNDLSARYYMAWDSVWLYLGAEVKDNFNDIIPHKPEPRRWYYKDCVAWFVEAPGDTVSETFGEGDHGFCFVADPDKPENGAWWRHGNSDTTYLEEPLPSANADYSVKMNPWNRSEGDYIIEARINLKKTLATSDPNWTPPKTGDIYRMMVVHTDPDGGDYGGHLLIYGKGDDDISWTWAILAGPREPVERKNR